MHESSHIAGYYSCNAIRIFVIYSVYFCSLPSGASDTEYPWL